MTQSQFNTITQITLDDIVASFGWQNRPLPSRVLRSLFLKSAQALAHQMTDFDSTVGESGLAEGARNVLRRYFRDMRVFGKELIPDSGFLALSNHPGASDTLVTFAALNRPDLKII